MAYFPFLTYGLHILFYAIGRVSIYALSFGFVECEAFHSRIDIGFFGERKPGSEIYVLPAWATTIVGLIIFAALLGIIAYLGG